MARPTTYNEEILKRADIYLDAWEELGDAIPSVASLSVYLGIPRRTLYEWSSKQEKFSHTLENILALQETTLLSKGLTKQYDSPLSRLILGNHGYSERHDHTTKGEKLPQPLLGGATKEE